MALFPISVRNTISFSILRYILFFVIVILVIICGAKNAEQEVALEVVMNSQEFNSSIFTGGKSQWLSEWAGHNALYEANIFRDRTGSVDVNELE